MRYCRKTVPPSASIRVSSGVTQSSAISATIAERASSGDHVVIVLTGRPALTIERQTLTTQLTSGSRQRVKLVDRTQLSLGDDRWLPHEASLEQIESTVLRALTSQVERELPDGTKIKTQLVRDTWGLGVSSVYLEGLPGAGLYMFSSTTPIDRENTLSRWLLTSTKNMIDVAGEDWINGLTTGVLQDMRIWKNKIHRARPVLCEADQYLAEFRRWCKQFYSEPA